MDQAFGRLPPGKKLCLADILHINSPQHYIETPTLSEAAYQTPGYEAIVLLAYAIVTHSHVVSIRAY